MGLWAFLLIHYTSNLISSFTLSKNYFRQPLMPFILQTKSIRNGYESDIEAIAIKKINITEIFEIFEKRQSTHLIDLF